MIMFITNLFIVIPSFVLLILISFSIGQEQRGAFTIAVVIGFPRGVDGQGGAVAGDLAAQPTT